MLSERNSTWFMESEELLRLLIDTKDYCIAMISPSGNIIRWNLGGEHIFGYPSHEINGSHISTCYPKKDHIQDTSQQDIDESIKNGRVEKERQLQKKDGSLFYANIIYTPLYKGLNELHGFAVIIRDISRQKQLEEENRILHNNLEEIVRKRTNELQNVNKELNAFSYSVSHDLRTPLRAISGFSKMLLEDYQKTLDAEGNRMLNTIIENAHLMGQLIDDLLAFSRLSRLEVMDQTVDMKKLVDKCFGDLTLIWNQREYSITVDHLPLCNADPNMMKQVWMNLIENALKYSSKKERPELKIGFSEDENAYTYFIKDNGVGFDMRYASKLFTVFQRLHSNEDFEGTGLGLALVNRIVSKHGGRIWAVSGVDTGATFFFTVPKIRQVNAVADDNEFK